jgi:hypothetical protein
VFTSATVLGHLKTIPTNVQVALATDVRHASALIKNRNLSSEAWLLLWESPLRKKVDNATDLCSRTLPYELRERVLRQESRVAPLCALIAHNPLTKEQRRTFIGRTLGREVQIRIIVHYAKDRDLQLALIPRYDSDLRLLAASRLPESRFSNKEIADLIEETALSYPMNGHYGRTWTSNGCDFSTQRALELRPLLLDELLTRDVPDVVRAQMASCQWAHTTHQQVKIARLGWPVKDPTRPHFGADDSVLQALTLNPRTTRVVLDAINAHYERPNVHVPPMRKRRPDSLGTSTKNYEEMSASDTASVVSALGRTTWSWTRPFVDSTVPVWTLDKIMKNPNLDPTNRERMSGLHERAADLGYLTKVRPPIPGYKWDARDARPPLSRYDRGVIAEHALLLGGNVPAWKAYVDILDGPASSTARNRQQAAHTALLLVATK